MNGTALREGEHHRAGKRGAGRRGLLVNETVCRTILSPSGIPGFDFSINPYVGCSHDCAYCYAFYMQRHSGHEEPWGSFVDAKVNAPRVLIRQLRRTPPAAIFMSSVTDPYQPSEKRFRITRQLLQILAPLPHAVHIHTKSTLVERDLDILRRFRNLSVCFTIVTIDGGAAARLEPGASPPAERLRVVKKLNRAGISTSVFMGPLIPYVTERRLEKLLLLLADAGVKKIMLDDLHYFPRIRKRLLGALRAFDGDIARRYQRIPKNYYQQIARIVLEFCRRHGMRCLC